MFFKIGFSKKCFTQLLFVCLSIVSIANAQNDVVVIKHKYYTCWFSQKEHIPLVVTYTLTQTMLDCGQHIARAKRFTPDPEYKAITNLNRDYKNSGYDRGHNMNADDNHCDSMGMKECFYFSNMTPPNLILLMQADGKIWKKKNAHWHKKMLK